MSSGPGLKLTRGEVQGLANFLVLTAADDLPSRYDAAERSEQEIYAQGNHAGENQGDHRGQYYEKERANFANARWRHVGLFDLTLGATAR